MGAQPPVSDRAVAGADGGNALVEDLSVLAHAALHVATAPARWEADTWLTVPTAAVAALGLSALDQPGRDFMRRNRSDVTDGVTAVVEPFGADYSFAVVAGLYLTGVVRRDGKARSVAMEALASSLIAGGLVTPTLQYVTGRYRPWRGEDPHTWDPFSRNISFPSGHTTQAFAVASVIAARYDRTWVKVSAYALASAVGLSRMYHDAHYFSDVATAAFIGTVVGNAAARYGRARGVSVAPFVGGHGAGLAVRF
jgi:membrane-associated phospholipid phosphatase